MDIQQNEIQNAIDTGYSELFSLSTDTVTHIASNTRYPASMVTQVPFPCPVLHCIVYRVTTKDGVKGFAIKMHKPHVFINK